MMATVTKAKTLKFNKAHIVYIARGKPCDAEMAGQPALVRAIKTEMTSQELEFASDSMRAVSDKGERKAQRREGRKRHTSRIYHTCTSPAWRDASDRVGRNDRLGSGYDNKESRKS